MAKETKASIAYRVRWNRQHSLSTTNGRVWGLRKRERPNNCELCDRQTQSLDYHHWDDNNFNNGLWFCNWCHGFADRYDKGLLGKYLTLRKQVDAEWHPFK